MQFISLPQTPPPTSPPLVPGLFDFIGQHPGRRVIAILLIASAAHILVLIVRHSLRLLLSTRPAEHTKVQTLAKFASSIIIFLSYFAAVGLVFHELGVSLTAYVASATVIGFAVSFGSQGIIQDVITGITVITSDLIDVGDMVDLGGQIGIIERIGIRFTVLVNLSGARVFIPNRNVANVINYEYGYIRVFLDVTLPSQDENESEAVQRLRILCESIHTQFRGIILVAPKLSGPIKTASGTSYIRIKFRVWPGQGTLIENAVRQMVISSMRSVDVNYAESRVVAHYRAEPSETEATLPRPAAVLRRSKAKAAMKKKGVEDV